MRRILGIAVLLLAGCAPVVSQQLPAYEAQDWSDPALLVRFRATGHFLPHTFPAPADEFSLPAPDAPSALSAAATSDGDSSSAAHPAPKPKGGADSASPVRPAPPPSASRKFHWAPALRQSLLLLAIEHGFRLGTQDFTRKQLKGPFFQDWFDSVTNISGWDDGDSLIGNYVGHPMQGAIAGYIQIQNDPTGMRQQFGKSPEYWKSRMRALAWSAAFSVQYELGPLSDASIGNSGLKDGSKAAVDLVITPVAGLGWLVTEDAVDRYVIGKLEQKTQRPHWKAILRTGLNPSRSFANVLRHKAPWHRDTREGSAAASGESPRPATPRPPAATPPAPAPPVDSAKPSCAQPCQ